MRLLACLIVAPQRGYDEPAILSYAISSFYPTSADGLHSRGVFDDGLLGKPVTPGGGVIGCVCYADRWREGPRSVHIVTILALALLTGKIR